MKGTAVHLRAWLLSVGVLAVASVALGSESQPAAPAGCPAAGTLAKATVTPGQTAVVAETPSAAPAEAGMRAFIDPETGTISSQPVGAEKVEVQNPEVQKERVVKVLANGTVVVDVAGLFEEYSIIQLDPNGRRVASCVQRDAVSKTLKSTPEPEDR
jgi:hypothetical protein